MKCGSQRQPSTNTGSQVLSSVRLKPIGTLFVCSGFVYFSFSHFVLTEPIQVTVGFGHFICQLVWRVDLELSEFCLNTHTDTRSSCYVWKDMRVNILSVLLELCQTWMFKSLSEKCLKNPFSARQLELSSLAHPFMKGNSPSPLFSASI